MMTDDTYDKGAMQAALDQARAAGERGEVPIGAVLVDRKTGKIVAAAGNQTREVNDPTAHAEVQVIRARCAELGVQRIPDHDLYVTLEPCTMCAAVLSFARVNRVIFGAADIKGGGVTSGVRFYDAPTCHHRVGVVGPVGPAECGDMLQAFFKERR